MHCFKKSAAVDGFMWNGPPVFPLSPTSAPPQLDSPAAIDFKTLVVAIPFPPYALIAAVKTLLLEQSLHLVPTGKSVSVFGHKMRLASGHETLPKRSGSAGVTIASGSPDDSGSGVVEIGEIS